MSTTPDRDDAPDEKNTSALWTSHIAILKARGIPADFAEDHSLRSVDLREVKRQVEKFGTTSPYPGLPLHPVTGILMEYQLPADGVARYRVRVDETEVSIPGPVDGSHHGEETLTIPRYLTQAGVSVIPYIPKEVFAIAGDTTKPVFVVEAPIKAMSLTANGFPAIGLGGVLAGANDLTDLHELGEITLSEEMRRVDWRGRVAYVVFDAGVANNPMVATGAARLAHGLMAAGANVQMVNVPFVHPTQSDPESGKIYYATDQGPDDYLALHGVEAFQRLVEAAVPANVAARMAAIPRGAGSVEAAGRLLGDLTVQAMLNEGGQLVIDQVVSVAKGLGCQRARRSAQI